MAAPRDPHATLDVPEQQVLIDFFGDAEGLNWHRRLCIERFPDGKWVVCTPDHDIESLNLQDHR
eukprot:9075819-Lingulodinium_polyedra.AAC.1